MNSEKNYLIKRLTDPFEYDIEKLIPNLEIREYFASMYLMDLSNFRAFGIIVDDNIEGIISCYKSINEASWFLTHVFYNDVTLIPKLFSHCVELHEQEGFYKFYSLISEFTYDSKIIWEPCNSERYIYVDECKLPAKTKSFYNSYWMILQERILLDQDCIVRCNFLKQEYRKQIPIGGNI